MQQDVQLHFYQSRAMNTEIETILHSQSEEKNRELEKIVDNWFQAVERRFSRFLPDSELSYVNDHSGGLTLVSPSMAEVLALAESYNTQTEGIFTPLVHDALRAAGYDRSFEKLDKENANVTDDCPVSPGSMTLHPQMKAVQLHGGAHLDLGGIVKGWSAGKLAGRLQRKHGVKRGLVNAGGDLQVWGGSSLDEPWNVGIASPWDIEEELTIVSMRDGAVATSSVSGRRWNSGHGQGHHLIDPRTMKPADSDIVQCSIAGDNLVPCEIWAKAVCIVGLERGLALLQKHAPRMEAFIVTQTGEIHFWGNPDELESRWDVDEIDFFHENSNGKKGESIQ